MTPIRQPTPTPIALSTAISQKYSPGSWIVTISTEIIAVLLASSSFKSLQIRSVVITPRQIVGNPTGKTEKHIRPVEEPIKFALIRLKARFMASLRSGERTRIIESKLHIPMTGWNKYK